MATTVEVHDLDQTFTIDPSTLFLVSKSTVEYKFSYGDAINRIEQDLKSNARNFNWNAKYFDDIPINSNGTQNERVMMYLNNQNAYVPTTIVPDHINWADSVSDQRWLRLDSNGDLTSDDVYVADILPSSNYTDYSNKFLILRVSSDGQYIYEYDLDTSDFITQPQDNVADLNNIVGDQYKVGNITLNRPGTDDGYLLNLKSDDYDSQSQLFMSTDSNKIRYRRHDGTSFQNWITIYNDSENPLSDSITNASSSHIATSQAVKTVKDDLTALDNSLTPQYLLDQIRQVDGDASDLNADKMHDISGDEYATMFDGTPISKLPEQAIRFNHNTRIFEEKSSGVWQNLNIDGNGIITAQVGSKGTVAFADVQEARNGDPTVATSPESVHSILQKYGLSNDQDPGEEVTNADITFTSGFYRLPSSATGNPFSNSASLIVYRPGINNWVHQIVIKGNSTETNVRYYDGSVWSSWTEYFNTEISGTTGIAVLKSETQDEGRLALGMDVGTTGFDLIESETISDARNALDMSQTDSVNFGNVTVNGNNVYHEGNMSITDSRTSTATDEVVNAKGMNDHVNSGDHDNRYYTQQEVDQLIAQASGTPSGGIIMWSGSIGNIPAGWVLCNGSNGSPDLRDRFIVGAGGSYSENATGGQNNVTLSINEIPSHYHDGSTSTDGNHNHFGSDTDYGGIHNHQYKDRFHKDLNFSIGDDPNVKKEGTGGVESRGSGSSDADNDVYFYIDEFTENSSSHNHDLNINFDGNHNHTFSTNNTGGDGAHENRPPYYALAFIMKL